MDTKSILGIVAALIIAAVSAGLTVYRDVGVLAEALDDVDRDLALRDRREREMRDSVIRLEERLAAKIEVARCIP